jgi:hypothetical protein
MGGAPVPESARRNADKQVVEFTVGVGEYSAEAAAIYLFDQASVAGVVAR